MHKCLQEDQLQLTDVVGAGTVSWVNTSAMDRWGNEQALAGMGGPGSEVH